MNEHEHNDDDTQAQEHAHENVAEAQPTEQAPQGPRQFFPPPDQVANFYRQRCTELTQALTDTQLQVAFQNSLIESLIAAQTASLDTETVDQGASAPAA